VGGVAAATQRGAGGERNPLVTDAWAREVLLGLDPFLLLFEFELNFNNSNDILYYVFSLKKISSIYFTYHSSVFAYAWFELVT
jgi:hypothetical protein